MEIISGGLFIIACRCGIPSTNIETAAIESAFAVLTDKSGSYKVLYLGTGGTVRVVMVHKQILAAAKDFRAERAVLEHNHPSETLTPHEGHQKNMAFSIYIYRWLKQHTQFRKSVFSEKQR
jgi:hypothetical protein